MTAAVSSDGNCILVESQSVAFMNTVVLTTVNQPGYIGHIILDL